MGEIKIKKLTTELLDIPIKRPHQFATVKVSSKSFVLIRLELSNGFIGIGEGTTPGIWWNGESVETMQLVIEQYIAPLLAEEDPRNLETLLQRINRHIRGNAFAKATVEMALYDVIGKIYNVPVYQLLGGLYQERIPVRWSLASGTPEGDIQEAKDYVMSGQYHIFKIKSGKASPSDDVRRSIHIADGIKDDSTIGIDPNGSWDRLTSKKSMEDLSKSNIDFIEQPLPPNDIEGLAQLADMKQVPIMADESLQSIHDALRLVDQKAADIFSLKIHKSGGMKNTVKIAGIAEAAGISCFGGTSLESSIGTAACLHAYCSISNLDYGSELFGPDWLADDLVTDPITIKEGQIQVPHQPGLGVELDEDKIATYKRTCKQGVSN
ncbi:muconate/chloromuconate family cycloisomerase [Tuberibacillus sp. Marseille-P3662]|uniref:muconate/chloromuconate family cycloisomerase n=1 Tax=Tuberibacillus sp. Marseille-P3662 TaxID=1965358 RepID=UPI000A1CAE0C|nr:muconate/chloromuconate family cycloisomerase [Tuberibacillus sp. Marseille-P3662]